VGTACSPAVPCLLPNEVCSPGCGTPPPTGTCFDTTMRKCTAETCGPDTPCLPNQVCVTVCPVPPPSGHCFVTVDNQCSSEPCGPGVGCTNPNEFCDPQCGRPACTTNADGTCGGVCPAANEVCTPTGGTCACMPTPPPACGDSVPTCNGICAAGSTCVSVIGASTDMTGAPTCQCVPGCSTDLDCDDGNACTADQCVNGTCEHACVCVTPLGGQACCPGPGLCAVPCGMTSGGTCGGTCPVTEVCTATGDTCACTPVTPPPACGDSAPTCNGTCPVGTTCESTAGAATCECVPGCAPGAGTLFSTCGDPVCSGHRAHPGIPPCTSGDVVGAPCMCLGAACDPGDMCNTLLECATSDPTHGGLCPL
jgi:hypothetical protein